MSQNPVTSPHVLLQNISVLLQNISVLLQNNMLCYRTTCSVTEQASKLANFLYSGVFQHGEHDADDNFHFCTMEEPLWREVMERSTGSKKSWLTIFWIFIVWCSDKAVAKLSQGHGFELILFLRVITPRSDWIVNSSTTHVKDSALQLLYRHL
jgi:hypothetical protein